MNWIRRQLGWTTWKDKSIKEEDNNFNFVDLGQTLENKKKKKNQNPGWELINVYDSITHPEYNTQPRFNIILF